MHNPHAPHPSDTHHVTALGTSDVTAPELARKHHPTIAECLVHWQNWQHTHTPTPDDRVTDTIDGLRLAAVALARIAADSHSDPTQPRTRKRYTTPPPLHAAD